MDEAGTVYVAARRLTRAGLRDVDSDDADPEMILTWTSGRGLRVFADDFRQLEGLALGDGVVFAVHTRPVQGTRNVYRVNLRHGVSRLRSGRRHTVGVIFHDAK